MKASEIREKLPQEIHEELDGCKRELLNLRFQWQGGELRNSAQHRHIRKDIARLKTILREAELGINENIVAKKKEEST